MKTILFAALLLSTAAAQPILDPSRAAVSLGGNAAIALPGTLRAFGQQIGDLQVRSLELGDTLPGRTFGEARLRVEPALIYRGEGGFLPLIKVAVDAEVTAPFGDETPLAYDPRSETYADGVAGRLSQAYALAAGRFMALQLGMLRPNFGQGLLANPSEDPAPDQVRVSPFGFRQSSDRHLSARLAAFPLAPTDAGPRLTLLFGADAILDEDYIRWSAGDRAYQAVFGVSVREPWYQVSLGGVFRRQSHAEGGRTDVGITALSAQIERPLWGGTGWIEGEFVAYFGETTFAESAVRPGAYAVTAAGGVLRAGLSDRMIAPALEVGYASGDANPFDREAHDFTFDSQYRVGLLLFHEVERAQTAVAAANVADPRYRGNPPRGFERTATNGAVRNAAYANPRVALRLAPWASLLLGYLAAVSEEPYVDVYQTGLAGGVPTGPRGAQDARLLGQEFDVGLSLMTTVTGVQARALVQFGYLLPGAALATDAGDADDVYGLWLGTEVRW